MRWLLVLSLLAGCNRDGVHGDRDPSDGDDGGEGEARFVECFSPEDCDGNLECVDLPGDRSFCLEPCDEPADCASDERCGLDGYCYHAVDYYEVCGFLDAC